MISRHILLYRERERERERARDREQERESKSETEKMIFFFLTVQTSVGSSICSYSVNAAIQIK